MNQEDPSCRRRAGLAEAALQAVPAEARRFLAAAIGAYALSPIDLIPDFIPVLGYVDDIVIVPLGILAAIALMPPALLDKLRAKAATLAERPASLAAAVVIAAIWVSAIGGTSLAAWRHFAP